MRAWVWGLGLVAGLAAAGQGHAQMMGFGGNGARTTATRQQVITTGANIGSTSRIQNLFRSLNPFTSRNPIGQSNFPDPSSPDYLKHFGYKKLF